MATFRRFEDIEAWIEGRELARRLYATTRIEAFRRDLGLRDQIRRAAVSVMANIAEGFERDGNSEFIHFLSLAKGSAGEIRSHLYVAWDTSYLGREDFDDLTRRAARISMLLGSLMAYLKSSRRRGRKFS